MQLKSAISLLILTTFISLISPSAVHALAKFSTTYQVNYTVYPSGNTHVKFLINQTNNLSVVYATEFSLSVNHTKIENLRVADENTSLIPSIIKTRNGSIISFSFLNKVVGKDKNHFFTIEYDTSDVTSKVGSTWEINIPKLEPDENTTDYNIVLSLPANFLKPAFIDPKPSTIVGENYYFAGKSLQNKQISAVFGQEQFYRVTLDYFLQNLSNRQSSQQIALPPDTNYQKVLIEDISPKPESITTDNDGNWLAIYNLDPHEKLSIKATLVIKLSFLPSSSTANSPDLYLSSNEIWDYNNPLFTIPEIQSLNSPRSVYDYIVAKFTYDFNKINKQKSQKISASESLKNSESAICTDFTNTFIAIARKMGIPSREIQGYTFSENPNLKPRSLVQDVLHSWPEYYDSNKNLWIQIDPTWAKTTQGVDYFNKLDFNHIVFVIHGSDPNYPVTAGGYKNSDNPSKDVIVEPISQLAFPEAKLTIGDTKQTDGVISVEINNDNPVGFSGDIHIEQNNLLQDTLATIRIAPFSSSKIQIPTHDRSLLNKQSVTTIININGIRSQHTIEIAPIFSTSPIFFGLGGLLVTASFVAGGIYFRKRKKRTALYR